MDPRVRQSNFGHQWSKTEMMHSTVGFNASKHGIVWSWDRHVHGHYE